MSRILIVDGNEENTRALHVLLKEHGWQAEVSSVGEGIDEENRMLKAQQETSLDAILVIGENRQILSYNAKFIELWGIPPELAMEGPNLPLLQFVASKVSDPDAFVAKIHFLYEHRDESSRDELHFNDGRIIDRYSAPIVDESGRYYGRIWYFRDVTAHRKAQDELQSSESWFRSIFDNVNTGIASTDSKGQVVRFNETFSTMLGYEAEALKRMNFAEFTHPEDLQKEAVFFNEILNGTRNHYHMVKRYIANHGRILWVDLSAVAIRDAGGKVTNFVAVIQDITEREQAVQALRESEERFRIMFNQAPMGIAMIDSLTGHIYDANPSFAESAGRSVDELKTIDWLQITHPDDIQADLENMALMNAGKINGFQMEKRYLHPDGKAVWIDMTITPLKVEDKTHPRHLCMIQDITGRKNAAARIVYLNRVYAMLSGINTLIVRVPGREELFREACRIAVETGGFRMAMLCTVDGSTLSILPCASAGKDDELMAEIKGILTSDRRATTMVARAAREKRMIISNDVRSDPQVVFGRQYVESGVHSMAVMPLLVSNEVIGVIALYAGEIDFFHHEEMQLLEEMTHDIEFAVDHIDKQERLNYLAYYDALTGLANRALFFERVGQFMRSAENAGHKLALVLIDLERFKNLNDSLGRTVGDALLRNVAGWLVRNTGGESLLARINADHFAAVIPEVRQEADLPKLFDKLSKAFMEQPFQLNDAVFRISAKAGIAIFPDDGDDVDTLFNNAEAALKMAKKSGDRYLFHTKKMTETVAGRLKLENRLRQAIDDQEFELYYQPKVHLSTGKVTSAEALIRWNCYGVGVVQPGDFIAVLEETGLIYEVGRWALRQAIADYLKWMDAGLAAVRIAVNVSALQLRNLGFVAEIGQDIAQDPRAAGGLEIEITESMIMEDVQRNVVSLNAIREMGVHVSIDDFGTGFSSLALLSRLPVNTLKIDRSFVIDMGSGEAGVALVSTIISLAHALKLNVVAEGVETEEQAELLRKLGCDEMQGFLFEKPLPAKRFAQKHLAKSR